MPADPLAVNVVLVAAFGSHGAFHLLPWARSSRSSSRWPAAESRPVAALAGHDCGLTEDAHEVQQLLGGHGVPLALGVDHRAWVLVTPVLFGVLHGRLAGLVGGAAAPAAFAGGAVAGEFVVVADAAGFGAIGQDSDGVAFVVAVAVDQLGVRSASAPQ